MRKKSILLIVSIVIAILLVILPNKNFAASSNLLPTACNNINVSLRKYSALVLVDSGYMRVFYDDANKNIGIEYYDNNFKTLQKKTIKLELEYYGGFYAGSNAYYIVEGQSNTEENDNKEVIRVIKYDKNWKKLGTAKITGETGNGAKEIRYPFDVGCVEMTEVNGKLYIVTGHQAYVDPSVRSRTPRIFNDRSR